MEIDHLDGLILMFSGRQLSAFRPQRYPEGLRCLPAAHSARLQTCNHYGWYKTAAAKLLRNPCIQGNERFQSAMTLDAAMSVVCWQFFSMAQLEPKGRINRGVASKDPMVK
ncbi:hypothetical protein ACVWWG_009214 [Bradyrhizobium sp. LB7.2]